MSALRDFLLAPRTGETVAAGAPPRARRRGDATDVGASAPSVGVLAHARDLPAAAAAVGLAIARREPAVLVCLAAPGPGASAPATPPAEAPAPAVRASAPAVRAPARPAAARLAASLRARGLDASARGRLALVSLDDVHGAARALAAAGPLPTVLAFAARGEDADAVLAERDAILVALPPTAEPAMAPLALAGASALAPATAVTFALDPVARALALAGLRAPRALAAAVREMVA
jgi:hypothetical protein